MYRISTVYVPYNFWGNFDSIFNFNELILNPPKHEKHNHSIINYLFFICKAGGKSAGSKQKKPRQNKYDRS